MRDSLERLEAVLSAHDELTVAVSGGVDSMTLATAAMRVVPKLTVMHAVSPAVPAAATERVRKAADEQGWDLHVVDAGEQRDPDYLSNPHNRCYFCKRNLFERIGPSGEGRIATGTNMDDLGDFRPGLGAAREHAVFQPYVEAALFKRDIRDIARRMGLGEISELPAEPCLASRIETGIRIDADDLAFVERVEGLARELVGPADIRCRITREGVRLETSRQGGEALASLVERMCRQEGRIFAGVAPYRRGSAFVVAEQA